MGAHILFRLGLEHPERCGKIVLNTGQQVNFKRTDFKPILKPHLRELTEAAVNNPNHETIRARLEWLMTTPDRVTDELVELRLKYFSFPELNAVLRGAIPGAATRGGAPRRYEEEDCKNYTPTTLVFWTEFNPSGGPDIGEYFAGLIPGAKWYLMKDAAHWPQWEHPEEHDQVITDFIQGRL